MGLLIYCNFYLRPDELRLANIFYATANIRSWSFHFRKRSSVKLNKWQFSVEINSARIDNLLLYFWPFFWPSLVKFGPFRSKIYKTSSSVVDFGEIFSSQWMVWCQDVLNSSSFMFLKVLYTICGWGLPCRSPFSKELAKSGFCLNFFVTWYSIKIIRKSHKI